MNNLDRAKQFSNYIIAVAPKLKTTLIDVVIIRSIYDAFVLQNIDTNNDHSWLRSENSIITQAYKLLKNKGYNVVKNIFTLSTKRYNERCSRAFL